MHRSPFHANILARAFAAQACILGVFAKQLALSVAQTTEISLENMPIKATKTREMSRIGEFGGVDATEK